MRIVRPLLVALLLAGPVVGQEKLTPVDSTEVDSAPPNPHHPLMLPAIVGAGLVMFVAPPLLLLPRNLIAPDSTRILPNSSLTLYLTGGGIGERWPTSWTNAEHLEVLSGHLYGAASIEHFHVRERLRYYTLRAGYLFRPKRGFAGGLTLGYRRVSGGGGRDAALIGLPFMTGFEKVAARFEPIYVISRDGVSWTLRFQAELYGLPEPLLTGFVIDVKPLRQNGPYQTTLALLFGIRR
jgi:hypothetical protein